MMNRKKRFAMLFMTLLTLSALTTTAFAAGGDVSGAIQQTWTAASGQVKTVVDTVVFPALDMILAIAFFVKVGTAYFDYRQRGQFEWAPPAILLVCLIFCLTAPSYIWGMTKADAVIICGDCGVLWHGGRRDEIQLELLEDLPFTIAFVDGNHENFAALSKYPVGEWNGGKVQFLRPHVIHLMRGQVFTLEGRTLFTMGGASSHDVEDGILDPAAPDYYERLLRLLGEGRRQYRIVGQSWWPEELPSEEEYAEARRNLDAHGWAVDYIVTHSPPSNIAESLGRPQDVLTDFLEEVRQKARYRRWLFGHCHGDQAIDERHLLLWEKIVRIV